MAIDVDAKGPIKAAINAQAEITERGEEPVIIDLGKKNRKQVRKLRKGKPGRLLNRIEETIEQLRGGEGLGENVKPIIIIVRERTRKSKSGRRVAKMWGLG
jgi:hypothetical protein